MLFLSYTTDGKLKQWPSAHNYGTAAKDFYGMMLSESAICTLDTHCLAVLYNSPRSSLKPLEQSDTESQPYLTFYPCHSCPPSSSWNTIVDYCRRRCVCCGYEYFVDSSWKRTIGSVCPCRWRWWRVRLFYCCPTCQAYIRGRFSQHEISSTSNSKLQAAKDEVTRIRF